MTIMLARIFGVLGCGWATYLLWCWALQDGGVVRQTRIDRFRHEAMLNWLEWVELWEPDHRIPQGPRQVS